MIQYDYNFELLSKEFLNYIVIDFLLFYLFW